jgi:zinc protease
LYKRLVLEAQLATAVHGRVYHREIGGLFMIDVTAAPGVDLGAIERTLNDEMNVFLADDPPLPARELNRVKSEFFADFIRRSERIGGFGGKSDILAQFEVYGGDPGTYRRHLQRISGSRTEYVIAAARRWLTDGAFILEVHPFPEYTTTPSTVDRSRLPEPGAWPEVQFPEIERAVLSNGLELLLVQRDAVPVVEFRLLLDAGFSSDGASRSGTATLAMNMLDEGTESLTGLELSEKLALNGARLTTTSDLDSSEVSLSALKENLDESLDLFADVIQHPAFPEDQFERLRGEQLARIRREQSSPRQLALRVIPRLYYGDKHAYGIPWTGSGTESAVEKIEIEDLERFHATWFDPGSATLIVVGDTTLEEIRPKLEHRFKGWKPTKQSRKRIAEVDEPAPGVFLIDRPGSLQSLILAGRLAPPRANPQEIALEAVNEVLGGSFSARINMNLREDKGWSYGARSRIRDARGQRPFYVAAAVQTDKTSESMAEIRKELAAIVGGSPPSADELQRAKDKKTLTLPGRWETSDAVADSLAEMVRYDLGADYWSDYPARIRELTLPQLTSAAGSLMRPDGIVWVVIGDRDKVEAGIRELGFGEVHLITADGDRVEDDDPTALARN